MIDQALFLDISTNTGFAWRSESGLVTSGVKELPQIPDIGRYLSAYHDWLVSVIDVFDRDRLCVVYEAPFVKNVSAVEKLFALSGHTQFVCRRLRVAKYFKCEPDRIRKHFLGSAHGSRELVKKLTIDECLNRGFDPKDDNEADALAGLDYTMHCLKLPGLVPGGLFTEAV
ncbi:MAG: hypothetical protein ACPG4X_14565 [Pikeienuella sp.]